MKEKEKEMTTTTTGLTDLIPLLHTFTGNSLPPKPNKIVHPWRREEDELLLRAVEEFGTKRWHLIAQCSPNRTRKQCRERYCNHLDPGINKKSWSAEEDDLLLRLHAQLGNRWSIIKTYLPGRTANSIKNRYTSRIKKTTINTMSAFSPVNPSLYQVIHHF